jgi:predicted RNase H-like HicB family nuclease
MRFPVVIHKDKNTDFGVTVPDLTGCFSAGDTADEALTNVVEAIECHVEGLLIDGEPVPRSRGIEAHRKNRRFSGGIWALVDVDLSKLSGKAKRVNITLPERLLVQIDSFATRTGETRSGFLAHAAMEYVTTHASGESEQDGGKRD